MSNFINDYNGGISVQTDNPSQDLGMGFTEDKSNQDNAPQTHGAQSNHAFSSEYAPEPGSRGFNPSTPPYPQQSYDTTPGAVPPQQNNGATINIPTAKNRSSFRAKAILTCAAVALGCAALGFGLGLGGPLAESMLPSQQAANNVSAVSQPVVSSSSQTQAQYEPVQYAAVENGLAGIVQDVSKSVVSINISIPTQGSFNQATEAQGAGSGIIFSEDGDKVYIATNYHVIQDADKVTVSLDDETQVDAHYVGSDSQSDLAVIYVNKAELDNAAITAGIQYELASFGDSSQLQVGDAVVAIGNAMGEGKTATSGIISAINKQITIDGKTLDVIQTDAAINPGNSGGALVDSKGEVIGINTAKLASSGVEGMGYSIPSNDAKSVLYDLQTNGSVKKPYLGIQGMSITQQVKDMYGLASLGVYVESVDNGGAAQQAGIQPTDIIVGYNGTKITTMDELQSAISASNVGDKVTVYIYRQGTRPMQFDVTLNDANAGAKF